MLKRYATSARFPSRLRTTRIVATFVAGPASRNTSAAPGSRPFAIIAAAMGVDAVAQTYSGTPATSIPSIAAQPVRSVPAKKSSGTATTIAAESAKPTRNQGVRSSSSVPKA